MIGVMCKKPGLGLIFFLILPLVVILITLLLAFRKPLVVFPSGEDTTFIAWPYSDTEKTQVTGFEQNNERITLSFTHLQGDSFAGVGFNLAAFPEFMDISAYTHLTIKLTTRNITTFTVTIKLFADGITDINDSSSYRHLGLTQSVTAATALYSLPLSRFIDPAWWLRHYNSNLQTLGHRSLKNGCYLLIESPAGNKPLPGPGQLQIENITFSRNNLPLVLYLAVGAGLYYLLLIFLLRSRNRQSTAAPPQLPGPRKLKLESYRAQDLTKIRMYLEIHYPDPALSLSSMGHELGLSAGRISTLIKEEYHTTFKQELNRLRLTEASRLLQETDRQIIDIAFAVGYNDRSYFYKVFFKTTGFSPSKYRKQNS